MSKLTLGALCGLVFGAISVATMIPLSFADKTAAMSGAFVNRFAIGLVIAVADVPLSGWAKGLTLGLLLSLPDAIITKAWLPILLIGALGGTLIGWITGRG